MREAQPRQSLTAVRRARWVRAGAAALIRRSLFAAVAQAAVFGVLLFGVAGRVDWWRGWIYVGVVAVGTVVSSYDLWRVDPQLLAERLEPPIQARQSPADKVLLSAMVVVFVLTVALAPLDVFRLHGLAHPSPGLAGAGFVAVVVGWWIASRAMRDNAFAAPVVKRQSERGHFVVDTGLYAWVRHPMYAGGALFIIGTPLWLGSLAGLVPALLDVAILAARIVAEERFLRHALPAYAAYERRVRYRVIPLVW